MIKSRKSANWQSVSIWRKTIFVIFVLVLWQLSCTLGAIPKILLPSPIDVLAALIKAFESEQMLDVLSYSLSLISVAMALGFLLALVCSMLAILNASIRDIYNLIITVMDPIPSIAILPLAILWFGTGLETIVVIIMHSVIWPVSRNFIDGFSAVPKIYDREIFSQLPAHRSLQNGELERAFSGWKILHNAYGIAYRSASESGSQNTQSTRQNVYLTQSFVARKP